MQRMREQMDLMENTMTRNVNLLQEMNDKNMKIIETSVKMAQEEAAEQRKEMIQVVKSVQERNAKLAKGWCEIFVHSCFEFFQFSTPRLNDINIY